MRQKLSKQIQWVRNASTLRRVNEGLLEAVERMPDLALGRASIRFHHIHLGPGVYPKDTKTGAHRHEQIQIEFVLEGQIRFWTGSERRVLRPGQGLLTGPEVPHGWDALSDVVMLGALLAVEGGRGPDLLNWISGQLGDSLRPFSDPSLRVMAQLGLDRLVHPEFWSVPTASHLFSAWLAQGLRTSLPLDAWTKKMPARSLGQNRTKARGRQLCARAVEFMTHNLEAPLQAHEIAREVGISTRHLNRYFDRFLGQSINRMLRNLRMKEAHRLLKSDVELSVKEVAYRTGFTSTSYFTRCFQEDFNQLPSEICAKVSSGTSKQARRVSS